MRTPPSSDDVRRLSSQISVRNSVLVKEKGGILIFEKPELTAATPNVDVGLKTRLSITADFEIIEILRI